MEENELKHVGVLGMKWGRRSAQTKAIKYERASRAYSRFGMKRKATRAAAKSKEALDKATVLDKKIKAKERERVQKNLEKSKKRVKETKDLIDSLMEDSRAAAAKKGKKFDAVKEKEYWDSFFKGQTTIKDQMRSRSRITKAQNLVENMIVNVGDVLLNPRG